RLDRETERAAGRLLDPLYELIPLLDRDERRAVLHAKRKVFQSRASGLSARVRAGLPSDIGAMLIDWDRLMAQRRNARTRLDKAVAADLENSRALLAHSLDDPDYLRSVAIAAPALVSTLARRGRRLDDPRVLRTLYSLASRTALKTSPFSGLTTVSEAGRPARGRRRCTVALHLAHGILMAVARDLDPAGHLRLEAATVRDDVVPAGTDKGEAAGLATDPVGAADAARPATGPALTVVAEHDYANGMIFRREEIQPARWLAAAHDRLTGGLTDAPPVSVREAVRLVGGRDPRLRLRRLLASGAVRPHSPWARGEDPFPALAATLSESQRGAWAEDLGRLVELGRAVTVEDGTDRAERLADAGRLAQRVFPDHELGARPAGLLYEDCESRGERTDPMEQVTFRRDVETLAGLVDPWVTRSRIYDLMVERYVARYGRGGVCEDPLAFFMSLAHAPDGDAQMLRAAGQDLASGPDPERAAMPGGVSASPRHVGAYLQPGGGGGGG
ncbi:MAG: lantibiotic dehydratase, partial [Actinomyces sp.]